MTSQIFAARPLATGCALAAVLAISPARAEEASEGLPQPRLEGSRTTAYRLEYFTQYAPSNALDIVRRVPGFVLEETDTGCAAFRARQATWW